MSPNESFLLDQVCKCMLIEVLAVSQTCTIHTYLQTYPGAKSNSCTFWEMWMAAFCTI